MTKAEARSKKRKEVFEAIIVRQEPVHLVARIFNVPVRTHMVKKLMRPVDVGQSLYV
jgi:hypothetical protein